MADVKENDLNAQSEKAEEKNTPPAELPPATPENLECEELQKQLEQSKDLLLRKAAEFENYKRRMENDMASIIQRANEDLLSELVPILDDFERSLKAGKGGTDYEAMYKGVDLIYQKFARTLEGFGVTSFETVGKPFDVSYHDALMQLPRTDLPEHTVVEEVARGYKLHDRVLRHAKVVVSTVPPETPSGDQAAGGV